MDTFIFVITPVAPVFILVLLGYLLRLKGLIDDNFVDKAMAIVFKLLLPAMFFEKIYKTDISAGLSTQQIILVVFLFVATIVGFVFSYLYAKPFISYKDNKNNQNTVGSFVQGCFRSNFALVGYPILLSMFGDAVVMNMALATIATIPLFNVLAVIALENRGDKFSPEILKKQLKKIITNPLIIGIILGFAASLLKIKLPKFAQNAITMLSQSTSTLALISIGGFITFDGFKSELKLTVASTIYKNIIMPTVFGFLAYFLGFSFMDVIIIVVCLGGPAAISSFSMSCAMGGNKQLSANSIIFTTITCMFTYPIFMAIFKILYGV